MLREKKIDKERSRKKTQMDRKDRNKHKCRSYIKINNAKNMQ